MKRLQFSFLFVFITINLVEASSLISTKLIKSAVPFAKGAGKKISQEREKLPGFAVNFKGEEFPEQISTIPAKISIGVSRFNLRSEKVVNNLKNGVIPLHLLNDPEFFEEAVEFGHRSLCAHLLHNGQNVKILKENGDNLFVKIIRNGMPELLGMLVERGSRESKAALDAVDATTGLKPFEAAIENGDLMAIYEIVSPRKSGSDSK